ncbi:uncharacterized protein LOC116853069 [Odontomachus brunneus]|uniref:uncharacterized protein LOC116853069 n=1 Tax=Odontomachus brunneus TaxID=486640 RepID=UPI0013F28862|nr:uncharacterized protein LOC116853069 [Odontomachus brunneus]
MKKFAFLVLVFSAAAIAEETGIKQWAENFDASEEIVKMCLTEADSTEAEMQNIENQFENIDANNINDETKKNFEKYNLFMACMMEKKEMMKDSKVVVDKLIELIEKDKDKFPIDKEVLKECLEGLNDDNELTRETRAMGAILCIMAAESKN